MAQVIQSLMSAHEVGLTGSLLHAGRLFEERGAAEITGRRHVACDHIALRSTIPAVVDVVVVVVVVGSEFTAGRRSETLLVRGSRVVP